MSGQGFTATVRKSGSGSWRFLSFRLLMSSPALRRNKGKVILCFVLIMGSTVALNVVLPRKYVSDAQLLVRLGRENATLDSTTNVRGASSVNMSQKREFETNSVATMLRSRSLIERVVDDLGPDAILHDEGETEVRRRKRRIGRRHLSRVMTRLAETKERLRSLIPAGVGYAEVEPRDEAIRELSEGLRVETVPGDEHHSSVLSESRSRVGTSASCPTWLSTISRSMYGFIASERRLTSSSWIT